ncbi:MAG TPA: hypothetical protein VF576_12235 [Rubricoccaceae bacterium]
MLRPLAFPAALAALALAAPASAQTFTTLQQDSQAQITDIASVGMGGAVAAVPTLDSPFFSNPAHMAGTERLSINVLGFTAGVGGNVRETYTFYEDMLGPAIEEGLDEIRTNDPDRLEALYDEAFRVGSSQKTADVAVLAPSVRMRFGQIAVGAGVYGTGTARAKISNGGAGIPYLDAYSQADVLVPLVVATDVPGLPFGLQAGASMTYVQRRISAKGEAVDALDPDSEKLYVFRGDGVRFGLGLDAHDVGTPGLDLGLAVTNVGSALDVEIDDSFPIEGSEDAPDDAAEIARLDARFAGRESASAVRAGAAYRIPVPAVPGFPISDVAVAADYTSASTSEFDQSFQAGLRGGVRATLARVLELRTGLSQGMVSAGISLKSRFARLDYATYGVEDGRLLGQQNRRNHVVQVRFGLF